MSTRINKKYLTKTHQEESERNFRKTKKVDNLAGINLMEKLIFVKHSDLERLSEDSVFKSVCPKCKEGTLLVSREADGRIRKHDICVLCGQHFIYTDFKTIGRKN